MKKLLHYADCLMLLAAIAGCGLRYWFDAKGKDPGGLFRPSHPAWLLLCLLSVGVVVFVWFLTRETGSNHRHSDNFPKSIAGAIAYWVLAAVMAYKGIMDLLEAGQFLYGLVALASMLSAICLAVAGVERFCGNQPVFFVHMVPCIYFVLRLFLLGKLYGTEPAYCGFLFQFLASVILVPALYWRWAFDMNMGNRRWALFFGLLAIYFCLVATFESGSDWLMYLLYGMFLLLNLCSLNRMPEIAGDEAEAAVEESQEVAVEEKIVEAPPVKRQKAVLHWNIDPNEDIDAFIEDIQQYLDDQGY